VVSRKTGGKLDLPSNAYGMDTKAYEEAYQEYVNQRQQDQAQSSVGQLFWVTYYI